MKYFRVTVYTPFCGEQADYFYEGEEGPELEEFIDECMVDNASEWYDEDTTGMDWDDYLEECGVDEVEEISKEEYDSYIN